MRTLFLVLQVIMLQLVLVMCSMKSNYHPEIFNILDIIQLILGR